MPTGGTYRVKSWMILKASQVSMEMLGKPFMEQDKLVEKDLRTSLMKKWESLLKATEKC